MMRKLSDDEAYALAVLGGLPIYNVSGWTAHLSVIAVEASVGSLRETGSMQALGDAARRIAENAADEEKRSSYVLAAEWIEESVGFDDIDSSSLDVSDDTLRQQFQHGVEVLADIGLEVPTDTRFEIQDEFPPPFDKLDSTAFCPDPEDERRFGIPAGIYLKRRRIRPVRAITVIAHELVHVRPGLHGGDLLAMGLEEGIAELLGNIIVGGRLLPARVADNDFSLSRLGEPIAPFSSYLNHTRQAFVIYAVYGTTGLIELLMDGRSAIHQAEIDILNGIVPKLRCEPGFKDMSEFGRVSRLIQANLPHLALSPLEYRVARTTRSGMSVANISEELGIREAVVRPVLEKLASDTMMLVLSGDNIEFANFDVYEDRAPGLIPVAMRVRF